MSDFAHQNGRRGRGNHDDDDYNKDLDLSKLSFYDENNSNDDEEDSAVDEDAIYNRGRSRSRSIHELDSAPVSADNIIAQHNSVDPAAGSQDNRQAVPVKTGPLNNKEILALKKGLEEATLQAKLPNNEEDDEEERIAAENERKQRLAQTAAHNAANSNSDATARRAKILMLGDSGVGKSSLIMRWTQDTFTPSLTSTVGVNFKSKKVAIRGEPIQVQVWDTAGQEQFHKITTSYYKGAQGIMLVYDVCDQKSFDNVAYWIKNIKAHASDSVQVALIGNKTDLRAGDEGVSTEKGRAVAAGFGVPFFETSAKDSTNVNDGFVTLVGHIVDVMGGGPPAKMTRTPSQASASSSAAGASSPSSSPAATSPIGSAATSERKSIVEKEEKKKMFGGLGGGKKKDKGSSGATTTSPGAGGTSPGGAEGDKKDCTIS